MPVGFQLHFTSSFVFFLAASSMSNTLVLFEAKDKSAVDLRLLSAFYGWANFGTVARSNLVEKILIQLVDVGMGQNPGT